MWVWRIMPNSESGCDHAVDRELRIEDLVPAVLAVGLGEHHQFDVSRIARELRERLHQVVHLVVGQRQTMGLVRQRQRRLATMQQIDLLERQVPPVRRTACAASARLNSTLSVMRSCSMRRQRLQLVGRRARPCPARRDFNPIRYSTMRSMRCTSSAQLCAMSVALEAQGDTVPRRGVTTTSGPSVSSGIGLAVTEQGRKLLLQLVRRRLIGPDQVDKTGVDAHHPVVDRAAVAPAVVGHGMGRARSRLRRR